MNTKKTLTLSENDVFAIYRLPKSKEVILILQNNGLLNKFDESSYKKEGFVFFPFDENKNFPVFINADHIYKNIDFDFKTSKKKSSIDISKKKYIEKISLFVDTIKKGFRKIVLSRTKSIKTKNQNIHKIFISLEKKYEDAFVFLVNHPSIGTWMGATPEILVSTNSKIAKTMALAGTQFIKNPAKTRWKTKEMEEQKAVMDYIETVLNNNDIDYTIDGPFTKIAANNKTKTLVHLATEYRFEARNNIFELIKQLHPTPAVSGLPQQEAIEFINKNEGYDREYYTGFLGPINIDNKGKIDLFVNLRSMKVYKNMFLLYLGGGLNSKSIAENEWQETENKAKTLEEVILNDQNFNT